MKSDRRRYSLQHLYHRARAFPETLLTGIVQAFYRITPNFLTENLRLELPTSGLVVIAGRAEPRSRTLLSVIMPVYNERATFETTLNAVLDTAVPDIEKEVIIVESNSTDGTRELALKYQDCLGVKLILEDRPRGKGHAVRVGLEQATGDFILIQDADSEYDVNDYVSLLDALRTYRAVFVLGSRHTGDWKMRKFNKQPGVAAYFNLGHTLFAGLMNVLYGQHMKDPFTMYKVFWRECLYGLDFECNRFDFDIELVAKLLRKGYVPLEIPVNYKSRSLREGKKVSIFVDPLTWLRAEFKYRFSNLYANPNKPTR